MKRVGKEWWRVIYFEGHIEKAVLKKRYKLFFGGSGNLGLKLLFCAVIVIFAYGCPWMFLMKKENGEIIPIPSKRKAANLIPKL